MDYYQVLGVSRNASPKQIKAKYRKLARKYHPDVAPPGKKEEYTEKMREINEAYEILKNKSSSSSSTYSSNNNSDGDKSKRNNNQNSSNSSNSSNNSRNTRNTQANNRNNQHRYKKERNERNNQSFTDNSTENTKDTKQSDDEGSSFKKWVTFIILCLLFVSSLNVFHNIVDDSTDDVLYSEPNVSVDSVSESMDVQIYQINPFHSNKYFIEGEGVSELIQTGYADDGDYAEGYKISLDNGDWYTLGIIEDTIATYDGEGFGFNGQGHPCYSEVKGEKLITVSVYSASDDKYFSQEFLESIIKT